MRCMGTWRACHQAPSSDCRCTDRCLGHTCIWSLDRCTARKERVMGVICGVQCKQLQYREETPALRKGDQFACHCNAGVDRRHLYFGRWSWRCLGWQGLTDTVILFFKLLLRKSCWTFPSRTGASLSPCLLVLVQTALVPQLWKSVSPLHFLVNYMEAQWIIHLPALMSHFHNWFPSFWDFAWHLSGLPDQAEVATIDWRNFNCFFKNWLGEKFFFWIDF